MVVPVIKNKDKSVVKPSEAYQGYLNKMCVVDVY